MKTQAELLVELTTLHNRKNALLTKKFASELPSLTSDEVIELAELEIRHGDLRAKFIEAGRREAQALYPATESNTEDIEHTEVE